MPKRKLEAEEVSEESTTEEVEAEEIPEEYCREVEAEEIPEEGQIYKKELGYSKPGVAKS